ncbi:MAG: hypothetical protein OEY01_16500 [Desulfobulbaceae bacterium]|nr:hypothetical protein [Desulfobulbaceae bacterium]
MSPQQLDLFSQPTIVTVVRDIKAAMNQAVKDSGKSRDQVIDLMNAISARHGIRLNGKGGLSKDTFEKWLNIEEEARMPSIKGLTVFCAALGTAKPIEMMVKLLGGMIIEGADITLLRWAKRYHQAKDIRKEMRELESEL